MRQPQPHRPSTSPDRDPAPAILREIIILFSNSSIPTFQPRIPLAPRRSAETKIRVLSERTSLIHARATTDSRRKDFAPNKRIIRRANPFRNSSFVIRHSEECHTVSLVNRIFHVLAISHLELPLNGLKVDWNVLAQISCSNVSVSRAAASPPQPHFATESPPSPAPRRRARV